MTTLLKQKLVLSLCAALLTSCSADVPIHSIFFAAQSANLEITPSELKFGRRSVSSNTHRLFTLKNTGTLKARITHIDAAPAPFQFKRGIPFPGLDGNCPTDFLEPGQSCQFAITFRPLEVAQHKVDWKIEYVEADSLKTPVSTQVRMTGEGMNNATLDFSSDGIDALEDVYDFGVIGKDTTVLRRFIVLYSGNWAASSVEFTPRNIGDAFQGSNLFSFESIDCQGRDIGASCAVVVKLNAATVGVQNGWASLLYNNGDSPVTAKLRVRATVVPDVVPARLTVTQAGCKGGGELLSADACDFGMLVTGMQAAKVFNVHREGTLPATQVSLAAFSSSAFRRIGGTCGATITGDCTVEVAFSPAAMGAATANFALNYYNGQSQAQAAFRLTGTGRSPADLGLFATQASDFGTVALRDSKDLVFRLRHGGVTGSAPATMISLSPSPAVFTLPAGVPNACQGATLNPGGECLFTVRFTPTDATTYPGRIEVTFNDGAANRTVQMALVGTGTTFPTLQVEPVRFDYGRRILSQISDTTFTLRYFGSDPAAITAPTLPAGFSYPGGFPGGGTCVSPVRNDCTFRVRFAPIAEQNYQASQAISYLRNGVMVTTNAFELAGQGARPALLAWDNTANPLDFGNASINYPVFLTATLKNTGGVDATSIAVGGLNSPFAIVSNSCAGAAVARNATCALVLRFQPTAVGVQNQTLMLTYQDGLATQPLTLPLRGNGIANALLAFALSEFHFGDVIVGNTAEANLRVNYFGSNPATAITVRFVNANPAFSILTTPASSVVGPFDVRVRFAPTAAGSFQDTLEVRYNDGAGNLRTALILVRGNGVLPAQLVFTAPTLPHIFPDRIYGQAAGVVFTLTNRGGVSATSLALNTLAAPFAIQATTCATSLAAGSTCNITVRFAPNAGSGAGSKTATLIASYFDGRAPASAQAAMQGTARDNALLSFSANTLALPAAVAGGGMSVAQVTINYLGGRPATVQSVSGVGGDFILTGSLANRGTAPLFGFGSQPTCGTSISASCSLQFYFAPANANAPLARAATFVLNYNDGYGPQSLSLALNATAQTPAVLAISPASYTFPGFAGVGSVSQVTLTVNKSGDAAARNVAASSPPSPFRFKGGAFPGTGGNCLSTISSSCTVIVEFAPTDEATYNGNVTLTYSDGVSSQSTGASLTGTSRRVAVLQLALENNALGDISVPEDGTPASAALRDLTVTNTGNAAANNLVFSVNGSASIAGETSPVQPCGTSLAAGASCRYRVRFLPTRPGVFNATASVTYANGLANVAVILPLQGRGVVPIQVAAHGAHTCVRNRIGKIQCWGANDHGQLGLGSATASFSTPQTAVVDLGGDYYARSVSVGVLHTCAILDGGSVKCWGDNNYGELGRGNLDENVGKSAGEMGANLVSVNLGAGVVATQLALGYSHSCALVSNAGPDNVKCWGRNHRGQLGIGNTLDRGHSASDLGSNLPFVQLGGRAKQISTKSSHTCAVLENSTVKCWGSNFYGQLGLGDAESRGDGMGEMGAALPAVNLGANRVAKAVTAGGGFSCAILDNGTVKCWGKNGDNDERGNLGTEWCEDNNNKVGPCGAPPYGEWVIGYGTELDQMGDALPIVNLGAGLTAKAIDAGTSHVCAILNNDRVKCWGDATYGQLGLGSTLDRGARAAEMGDALPVLDFGTVSTASDLAIGHYHGCAVQRDADPIGKLKCWGYNQFGGLGIGGSHRGDDAGEMGAALPDVAL